MGDIPLNTNEAKLTAPRGEIDPVDNLNKAFNSLSVNHRASSDALADFWNTFEGLSSDQKMTLLRTHDTPKDQFSGFLLRTMRASIYRKGAEREGALWGDDAREAHQQITASIDAKIHDLLPDQSNDAVVITDIVAKDGRSRTRFAVGRMESVRATVEKRGAVPYVFESIDGKERIVNFVDESSLQTLMIVRDEVHEPETAGTFVLTWNMGERKQRTVTYGRNTGYVHFTEKGFPEADNTPLNEKLSRTLDRIRSFTRPAFDRVEYMGIFAAHSDVLLPRLLK